MPTEDAQEETRTSPKTMLVTNKTSLQDPTCQVDRRGTEDTGEIGEVFGEPDPVDKELNS